MSLTGKTLANTYKDILQVDNSNNGVTTSTKVIKDGEGTSSALLISDDNVNIFPQNQNNTSTLLVRTNGGAVFLDVDTTNELVTASGNIVNTHYAYFGADRVDSAAYTANNHHPIPFTASVNISNPENYPKAAYGMKKRYTNGGRF